MRIIPASPDQFPNAIELISTSGLPVDDISSGTQLFVMEDSDEVIGTVAVEYNFNDALLRSLSVKENKRGHGVGQQLVDFIEDYVKKQGVLTIYLLTTTAAAFFQNRDYTIVPRETAPDFIQTTSEFRSVCPSTAVFMKKKLQD